MNTRTTTERAEHHRATVDAIASLIAEAAGRSPFTALTDNQRKHWRAYAARIVFAHWPIESAYPFWAPKPESTVAPVEDINARPEIKPQDIPISVTLTWKEWLALSDYAQNAVDDANGSADPDAISAIAEIDTISNAFERDLYERIGLEPPLQLVKNGAIASLTSALEANLHHKATSTTHTDEHRTRPENHPS